MIFSREIQREGHSDSRDGAFVSRFVFFSPPVSFPAMETGCADVFSLDLGLFSSIVPSVARSVNPATGKKERNR